MNIGIVGQGFVGNAVYNKFSQVFDHVATYDLNPELRNTDTLKEVVDYADVIFVAVPTPMRKDGSCDISILESVIAEINEYAVVDNTYFPYVDKQEVVIKSTIPPYTTREFNEKYENIDIMFNPEFLTEANAQHDFNNQQRIVLGGTWGSKTARIYHKVFPDAMIICLTWEEAEMLKYITNTFLSMKVSFANEIYQLCEKMEIDYNKIVPMLRMDDRLGKSHWSVPGPDGDFGFGGHCFPKDLAALMTLSHNRGVPCTMLDATQHVNDRVRKNRNWEQMKGRAVSDE